MLFLFSSKIISDSSGSQKELNLFNQAQLAANATHSACY